MSPITAQEIHYTNQRLDNEFGVRREWFECPYCENEHPMTLFPVRHANGDTVYLAECRLAGLMIVQEVPA